MLGFQGIQEFPVWGTSQLVPLDFCLEIRFPTDESSRISMLLNSEGPIVTDKDFDVVVVVVVVIAIVIVVVVVNVRLGQPTEVLVELDRLLLDFLEVEQEKGFLVLELGELLRGKESLVMGFVHQADHRQDDDDLQEVSEFHSRQLDQLLLAHNPGIVRAGMLSAVVVVVVVIIIMMIGIGIAVAAHAAEAHGTALSFPTAGTAVKE